MRLPPRPGGAGAAPTTPAASTEMTPQPRQEPEVASEDTAYAEQQAAPSIDFGRHVTDELVKEAALDAAMPLVSAARARGPLPPMRTEAFVNADIDVQRAVLLLCGIWLLLNDPFRNGARQLREAALDVREAADWRYLISGGPTTWTPAGETPQRADMPYPGALPFAVLRARRDEPITPVRCTGTGCRTVVSVPHPLPDLRLVRCPRHLLSDDQASAA